MIDEGDPYTDPMFFVKACVTSILMLIAFGLLVLALQLIGVIQ